MFAQFQDTLNRIVGVDAPPVASATTQEVRSLVEHANDFSSEEDDDDTLLPMVSNANRQEQQSFLPTQFTSFMSSVATTIQTNVGNIRQNITGTETTPATVKPPQAVEKQPSPKSTANTVVEEESWTNAFANWKDQAKSRLGTIVGVQEEVPQEPKGFFANITSGIDEYTTLSKTNRIYGFAISAGLGALFLLIAIGFLPSILIASRAFAFFYTIGNFCLVLSTFFVVGPMRQIGMMLDKDRLIPSVCFISSLILTMIAAVILQSALLVLLLIVVQIISLGFYILSYIPFGQQIASSFFTALTTAFRAMF